MNTMLRLPAVALLLLAGGCSWTPDLSKNQDRNQVMYAAWQYTSVAKACGHEEFRTLRAHLVQFVQLEEEKGTLTWIGKLYFGKQGQMDWFIDRSVKEYEQQPFLSCSSAIQYYAPLMEGIRFQLAN